MTDVGLLCVSKKMKMKMKMKMKITLDKTNAPSSEPWATYYDLL